MSPTPWRSRRFLISQLLGPKHSQGKTFSACVRVYMHVFTCQLRTKSAIGDVYVLLEIVLMLLTISQQTLIIHPVELLEVIKPSLNTFTLC